MPIVLSLKFKYVPLINKKRKVYVKCANQSAIQPYNLHQIKWVDEKVYTLLVYLRTLKTHHPD